MLFGRKDLNLNDKFNIPIFENIETHNDIPKNILGKKSISPKVAYRLIKDELLDEGNARLNLATFCQTYMEPEATQLISETLDKNAIDKSEYPQTAELENRCISMLADLWNTPDNMEYIGTSTVGSSEACMIAGMAMKFRWRKEAENLGIDIKAKMPNLIISSAYQVCWEKFCVYWDIELRIVPLDEEHMTINTEKILDYVDEYTIGIVGILGITYTGKLDDIKELNNLIGIYNETHNPKVYIHVDGASGGLFIPFVDKSLEWDFRLENVISINTSGHKYGLVYPGIGWVLWKDKKYLPQQLIFEVNYLGGKMPTMAINFSRSASQIIAQYYNFLRFGFNGYSQIHKRTKDVAMYIAKEIEETELFDIYNNGKDLPIVCYKLKSNANIKWTLYDLTDRLQMKGWQIPSYPLPENLQNIIIQRVVCRADLSFHLAQLLVRDFKTAIENLNKACLIREPENDNNKVYGFTH